MDSNCKMPGSQMCSIPLRCKPPLAREGSYHPLLPKLDWECISSLRQSIMQFRKETRTRILCYPGLVLPLSPSLLTQPLRTMLSAQINSFSDQSLHSSFFLVRNILPTPHSTIPLCLKNSCMFVRSYFVVTSSRMPSLIASNCISWFPRLPPFPPLLST